jgi:hypothetical protein
MDFVRLARLVLRMGRVSAQAQVHPRQKGVKTVLAQETVEMVVVAAVIVVAERVSGSGLTVAAVLVSLAMARARGARD